MTNTLIRYRYHLQIACQSSLCIFKIECHLTQVSFWSPIYYAIIFLSFTSTLHPILTNVPCHWVTISNDRHDKSQIYGAAWTCGKSSFSLCSIPLLIQIHRHHPKPIHPQPAIQLAYAFDRISLNLIFYYIWIMRHHRQCYLRVYMDYTWAKPYHNILRCSISRA